MACVQLIVGTVGGTAWKTAQAAAVILNQLGHSARVNEESQPKDLLNPEEMLLICTSTTGNGELPPNIRALYSVLDDEAVQLTGRRYGVIALGDTGYPRFAHAAFLLEDALYRCGATRVGEILRLDAQVDDRPHVTAAHWVKGWINS